MRTAIVMLVVAFVAHAAVAADDGQTQPRVNYAMNNSSTVNVDIVPTTNGSGNVKGVHCRFLPNAVTTPSAVVTFTVDGGSAQSVTLDSSYLLFPDTADSTGYSGWVPFNIRFASSIRVQLKKAAAATGTEVWCAVSWALD